MDVKGNLYITSQTGLQAFDRDGKYLFFLSNRTLRPTYSDLDNSWIYANTTNLVAVSLRRGCRSAGWRGVEPMMQVPK